MSSQAVPVNVQEYLASVAGDRGEAFRAVFDVVHDAIPDGYELGDFHNAPLWTVPLETFPTTYNGDPLAYVGMIAQKSYNSLYLTGIYSAPDDDARFRAAWAATGRTLNMGKSCLRFKKLADVDLELIEGAVASMPVERFLAVYERNRSS